MNRCLFLLTAALALGCPAAASADVIWVDPAWTVTPTVSGTSPPLATGSASSNSTTSNLLNASLQAYAENPPGPGGHGVQASVQVSRSFRVAGTAELVALEVPIMGSLSVGPAGGSSGGTLRIQYDVVGVADISIFRTYSSPATISETVVDGAFLAPGVYTVQGNIQLNVFAFSGGPWASGNASVGVQVVPTPQPVPEPGGIALLAGAAVAALRAAKRNRT